MKTNSLTAVLLATTLLSALPSIAQQKRVASSGGVSPHETIGAVIGDRRTGCRVTITYGRPYSKDPKSGETRKIWGSEAEKALVPYGKAWRMGADEATLLITLQPLMIGETAVPAGAYTLYMVPNENGPSKLAISTKIGQWGVPVDESHDLARVDLKKEALEKPVDQFTMAIDKDPSGGGVIKLMWENTQFSVPFTVKK
jgi:Protein of unknown function (DUF2911)